MGYQNFGYPIWNYAYGLDQLTIYRIRVYKMPLLIKPPLLENSIEIQINRHFFAQKSSFWGFFEQKLEKFQSDFNKPPPQTLDFFISRRRLIDADTVCIYY